MSNKSTLGTLLVIALLLLLSGSASYVLLRTGPETVPKEKSNSAKIVQTVPLQAKTRQVAISAFGSVIPSKKVIMKPQVTGRVIWQSEKMAIGGEVTMNDEIIRIDPKDYELALSEVKSNLEQARFEREVESGRQVIAQREWKELQPDLDTQEVNKSLVLREPHLRRAEALLEKAKNDIKIAELNLSRTVMHAPFNAMVTSESVEAGQLLNPGSEVCELVGTDEFWIQVTVPFSKLKWITFPTNQSPGAKASVILDTGDGETVRWDGEVLRLLSDLDPLGRMARILISVSDPLALQPENKGKLPLLLGSYVEVKINAGVLENVLTIPRAALREGNKIWVVGADNRLQVLSATILWPEKETFLIANNIENGEQLVVSDLRVALPGMNVAPQASNNYPELQTETKP